MFCGGRWPLITAPARALKRRHVVAVIHLRKRRLQSKLNHTLNTKTKRLTLQVLYVEKDTGERREGNLNRDKRIGVILENVEEGDEIQAHLIRCQTKLVMAIVGRIRVAKLYDVVVIGGANTNSIVHLLVIEGADDVDMNAAEVLRRRRVR